MAESVLNVKSFGESVYFVLFCWQRTTCLWGDAGAAGVAPSGARVWKFFCVLRTERGGGGRAARADAFADNDLDEAVGGTKAG